MNPADISTLSDDELMNRVEVLAFRARGATADVVEHLAEIDRRDLRLKWEYGSLFDYCINRLKMSEGCAYRHIRAARAYRGHPPLMNLLRAGRLSLESMALLNPHVKDEDFAALAARAAGMRTRQLEVILAERKPENPHRDVIRFGPARETAMPPEASASAVPLFELSMEVLPAPPPAPDPRPYLPGPSSVRRSVRLSFTADYEFFRLLCRARQFLRHKYPDGRLEGVLRDSLEALIARRDPVIRWNMSPRRRKAKR